MEINLQQTIDDQSHQSNMHPRTVNQVLRYNNNIMIYYLQNLCLWRLLRMWYVMCLFKEILYVVCTYLYCCHTHLVNSIVYLQALAKTKSSLFGLCDVFFEQVIYRFIFILTEGNLISSNQFIKKKKIMNKLSVQSLLASL